MSTAAGEKGKGNRTALQKEHWNAAFAGEDASPLEKHNMVVHRTCHVSLAWALEWIF
jgi:hypothetical protein